MALFGLSNLIQSGGNKVANAASTFQKTKKAAADMQADNTATNGAIQQQQSNVQDQITAARNAAMIQRWNNDFSVVNKIQW
jgi:hypothetical protein